MALLNADLPEEDQLYNIPASVLFTLLFVFVMTFALGIKPPVFGHPSFLAHNTALNFFLLVLISSVYGTITLIMPMNSVFNRFINVFLLILLIACIWGRAYVLYSTNLKQICRLKFGKGDDGDDESSGEDASFQQDAVIWNTAKLAIAIFVTYFFVVLFPSWTTIPFNEMYDSTHPIIFFIAVGFWCGCACWSAEASCYFVLQKYGCVPKEEIKFQNILSPDDNHDHDGTKPTVVSCS